MALLTPARASRLIARSKLYFGDVRDTRAHRGGNQQTLPAIFQLLVAGFCCGKMVLRSIEDLSRDIPQRIANQMGLGRAVSDTAQYELLRRTPEDGLRQALWHQLRRAIDAKDVTNDLFPGGAVSYDGKGAGSGWGEAPNEVCRDSVCDAEGSAFWNLFALRACLVSCSARPVLDQELIPNKKGEATTFPTMFARDVARFPKLFRYVLGDAGLASARNAQLVLDRSKVYLWQIKANFSRLFPLARRSLVTARVMATTQERYQGMELRRELRRVAVPEGVLFPGAKQLLGIRQVRTYADGSVESEDRVYITAIAWQELTPSALLQLVRLHWGIENGANWTADVILQEDSRRPCNQGWGPTVCSWLIVLAYNTVSIFRAHLPSKDRRPQSWERARELIYQAFLGIAATAARQVEQATLA